ncbi:glutaminyl-peptide cyclotransferase [Corynebacterium sp. CMW7794]|uniref:glutaminyl-peptide cyclotransferase n=1 Tax=Corynebacterium sp. CMW7794 TaxID=1603887 RepID=UPI0009E7B403|nr:glutaminyl-peptide cyclotransferase [Corynebacterium sp. CMW7794]
MLRSLTARFSSSPAATPRSQVAAGVAALIVPAALLAACGTDGSSSPTSAAPAEVEKLTAVVHETLPFDATSFTQGLEATEDGELWVGTGQYGESRLYRFDPVTGDERASVDLDPRLFGEGITQFEDSIWQLTWKAGEAIRYNAATLKETGRAHYEGEGGGLCALDNELIMSDGTAELRHLDPDNFEERSRVTVTRDGAPVNEINELECVDGHVYANVWFSTDILRIDPATGEVTGVIDASGVKNNAADDPNNVLNGIAHIKGTDQFYVTGKRWPDLYRVSFEPAASDT